MVLSLLHVFNITLVKLYKVSIGLEEGGWWSSGDSYRALEVPKDKAAAKIWVKVP